MNNRRTFLSSLVGLIAGGAVAAVSPKETQARPVEKLHINIHLDSNEVAKVIERDFMNNGRIRQVILNNTR